MYLYYRLKKNAFLRLFALSFVTFSSLADEDNEIVWGFTHNPPIYIIDGPHKGTGFGQEVTGLIQRELSHYTHRVQRATLPRILDDMKNGKNICYATFYKTEARDQFMWYSRAALLSPRTWVIAKKNRLNPLLKNGQISIDALLNDKRLVIANIKGRSYGHYLDAMLNRFRIRSSNWLVIDGQQVLFQLLDRDRLDATFGYSFELNYFKQVYNPESDLKIYAISSPPNYEAGFIGCTKNDWGKRTIREINSAISKLVSTPEYKAAVTNWWGLEAETAEFQEAWMNQLIKTQ